jgi:hypothetical protein
MQGQLTLSTTHQDRGTGIFKQVKHVRMNGQLNAMLANVFMNGLVANVVKNE